MLAQATMGMRMGAVSAALLAGVLGPWSGGGVAAQAPPGDASLLQELAAYFAEQLAGAGWLPRASRLDGPLAWSTWQVPGEGDWQGIRYVLEGPGPDQRSVHLQVATAAAPPR
jgi:hypothetical protein